jgi:hypothetical protein
LVPARLYKRIMKGRPSQCSLELVSNQITLRRNMTLLTEGGTWFRPVSINMNLLTEGGRIRTMADRFVRQNDNKHEPQF